MINHHPEKSLIDRKYGLLLNNSEFNIRAQTAMIFYEVRLPLAIAHEAEKYQEFISNTRHREI
jgi:hypothetical protein